MKLSNGRLRVIYNNRALAYLKLKTPLMQNSPKVCR